MGTYTPTRIDVPSMLDEFGLRLGLQRADSETMQSYRRRLLLEARDPSGPTEGQYINGVNRRVAEFDTKVFQIDLILDGSGDPVAADPYVEITSTHLRAYNDYANGTLDIELNLTDRADAYFLNDVVAGFVGSIYFTLTTQDGYSVYLRSDHLKYDSTARFIKQEVLKPSRENRLKYRFINNIYAQATEVFQVEVATAALVAAEGEYWIDYDEAVIITYDPMRGSMAYSYREFPYTVWWQTVRAWPYNDVDKSYRLYDTQIDDDTGLAVYTLLNSKGAELVDTVLAVHPLGWGK